jgi:hypothetical protein
VQNCDGLSAVNYRKRFHIGSVQDFLGGQLEPPEEREDLYLYSPENDYMGIKRSVENQNSLPTA